MSSPINSAAPDTRVAVRAFLSHTGSDKEFVEAVAKRLGRVSCVFDKMCFHSGDDFVDVIEHKLDESQLFVLFASRKSLASDWVRFEIDSASHRRVSNRIRRALVVAVEPEIPIAEYPEWLRGARIVFLPSAVLAAREIRSHLDMLVAARMPSTFVGRARESAECEAVLAPLNDAPPRIIVLFGLEGIGRRTLCKRAVTNLLQLRRIVQLGLSSADSAGDVAFRLRAELEPPSSPERLQQMRESLGALNESEAISTILDAFRTMIAHGELPTLLDEGGVLAENGEYTVLADQILRGVASDSELYVAVISRRKAPERLSNNAPTPTVLVRPLEVADVQRLLSLLLRQSGHPLAPQQLLAIAERAKGHPPSAYYAARLVQRYGPELTEQRGGLLEDFQASAFVRYLTERSSLLLAHQRVLRLLTVYNPLPLDVIRHALNISLEDVSQVTIDLIDLSLVVPDDAGLYALAGPVDVAVRRVLRGIAVDHERVAAALQGYLEGVDDADRHLILCQLAFRATAYSDGSPPPWAVQLARDVLQVAKESYHGGEYERAVKYARIVVQQRPNDAEAHRFLVRGLIQLDRFDDADSEVRFFQTKGLLQDYHFLVGFSERRHGHPQVAIRAYKRAEQVGHSGLALFRELALCYFLLNQIDEARSCIARASERDPDNRYLVDLELQIALAGGDLRAADVLIERLERVDQPAFVLFRRSMIAHARRGLTEAVQLAERAVNESPHGRPAFAMLAHLAKCLIDDGQFERAAVAMV
jgi:tetratricopeptide (TPR) repeat protein